MNLVKPKQKQIIGTCLLLSMLGLYPGTVFSYESRESSRLLDSGVGGQETAADAETQEIAQQLKAQHDAIEAIQTKINDYEKRIQSKRNEALSIKNQLSTLQDEIDQARLQLDLKRQQITEVNLQIKENEKRIEDKNKELDIQRSRIAEFARILYQHTEKNYIEILLANDVFSDFFDEQQHLKSVEEDVALILQKVKAVKQKLEEEKKDLSAKHDALEKLRDSLISNQMSLEEKITAKNVVLEATQADESKFQQLLQQVRSEQAQINGTIVSLEKRLREKLAASGDNSLDEFSGQQFAWPLSSRRVTATFHDPSYPFRRYFEHPAIDIATPQGTSIRAIASGYVAVAHDGGLGYSYVSIAHADGISSVYGHVSCILVSEDEFVLQGQVIACSGATPGTPGAGNLTTGPHLHLEVRLNGIPVNPLNYLP